ncbi:MAG TPA: hypothetical protein VFX61_17040 [Micromonosporaceae bacterium]|nr:hypothetical protein [Micromonosporaceae bacterium]
MTRRPFGRLITAVLLAILLGTSVHGASSVAAPISAIATAHASIGAALFRSVSSSPENDEDKSAAGPAAQCGLDEELRPPPDKSEPGSESPILVFTTGPAESLAAASTSASPVFSGACPPAGSRILPSHPGRAPPA